jgi:hypothetical protein
VRSRSILYTYYKYYNSMCYISICRWLYQGIFQKRLNKCIPSVSGETFLGEGYNYGANDRLGYSELEADEAT